MPLIVLITRYPVVLPQAGGDAVIGFEISALVFLTLTRSPSEALVVWALGQIASQTLCIRSLRNRLFNVGVTGLGGGVFVLILHLAGQTRSMALTTLLVVSLACAAYFLVDLVVTAVSLALESRTSMDVRWRSAWLPLLVFVAVSTIGVLAAVLLNSASPWTLGLLLVPIATILVAIRSVSESRLAQLRLGGLLDAATKAPDWADPNSIERTLIEQAEQVLRHSVAELRDEPPGTREIGHQLEIPGKGVRWLVARSAHSSALLNDPRRGRPGRADGAGRRQPEPAPADRRDGLPGPARPAHRPAEPVPARHPAGGRARRRHGHLGAVLRPGRLQGGQRPVRARHRRRAARGGGRPAAAVPAAARRAGPAGR